jgi:hypothetical protein
MNFPLFCAIALNPSLVGFSKTRQIRSDRRRKKSARAGAYGRHASMVGDGGAFDQAPKFSGCDGTLALHGIVDCLLDVGVTVAADIGEEVHADAAVLAVHDILLPIDQSVSLESSEVVQVSNRAAYAFRYFVAGYLVLRSLSLAGAVAPHPLSWCHGFIEDRRSCHLGLPSYETAFCSVVVAKRSYTGVHRGTSHAIAVCTRPIIAHSSLR